MIVLLTTAWLLLWILPIHSEAAAAGGNRIAADQLKNISRLSFTLHDAYQTPYTVYIYANDEKVTALTEEDDWTHNKVGDKKYTGTYRAALLKKGEQYGTVQSVKLGLKGITLPQTWQHTVASSGASMPDMLIISEWGSSNFNLVHSFVIRSGVLQPLKFTDSNGKKLDDSYPSDTEQGVRSLSGTRVQFKYYNNIVFKYAVDTFKLNVSKLELRLVDTRYVDQAAWPNSANGDRTYLESLKSAAIKGVLPANPQIKLGMTFKSVKDKLKTAKNKENGEWGAYYDFGKYAVGFNDYLRDLGPNSTVIILDLYVESRNLTPGNVKLWLGKPKEEYLNEEEGGYEMIYKLGQHTMSFYYAEDENLIRVVNIY